MSGGALQNLDTVSSYEFALPVNKDPCHGKPALCPDSAMPEEDKERTKACAIPTLPVSNINPQHTNEREQERPEFLRDSKDRGRVREMGCGASKPAKKPSGQKQPEKEEIDEKEPLDLIVSSSPNLAQHN